MFSKMLKEVSGQKCFEIFPLHGALDWKTLQMEILGQEFKYTRACVTKSPEF